MGKLITFSTGFSYVRNVMADLVRLSKFLSVMLRHRADEFGLTLDGDGYTSVDVVWAQVQRRYPGQYQYPDLLKVVDEGADGKRRFQLEKGRIRARYGHSAVSEVSYPPATPPEWLYHGTTRDALPSIRVQGLTSQQRQYVHLSVDAQWANKVGSRRTRAPIVLRIRALDAHRAGHVFYHPEDNHYLAKAVPPEFIEFPD